VIKNIEYKYRKLINIFVLFLYKILRAFYKNNNSELKLIISKNRKTLSEAHSLLSENQYAENNYGIPGNIFLSIDKPIDSFPTYSDIFIFISRYLAKPINYLEIGVSVLKNYIQMNESLQNSNLTCFDINPIAPNSLFIFNENNKKENSNENIFTGYNNENKNLLSYYKGSVLDREETDIFRNTYNSKFNFIFSDALHEHDAVISEYKNIIKGNLDEEFILYFDDLDFPGLENTINLIYSDIKKEYKDVFCTTFYINGWVGQHEKLHKNALISTIDFYEIMKKEKIKLPLIRKWT
tara:strand:- start:1194 stop:2078 length:885 start_codon:yes stop_codon:yes gene_type:complete